MWMCVSYDATILQEEVGAGRALPLPSNAHRTPANTPPNKQAYTAYSFRVYWGPELLHAKGWSVRRRYVYIHTRMHRSPKRDMRMCMLPFSRA